MNVNDKLADLSGEEKRALLARLLQKKLGDSQAVHPLSHMQQAMWLLNRLAPESTVYNLPFGVRIRSAVDVPALRRALQALVQRQASLRTTLSVEENWPVQVVHGYQEVHFETIDASGWSDAELVELVHAASRRPFDLEQGPLFRASLFTRSASDHVLLLEAHHIVVDGLSMWVVLDDLGALYAAETKGTYATLPPLGAQFTDYVEEQARMVDSAEGERLWAYWQQQLADAPPALDLPTDRPRPPARTFRGATETFPFGDELTARLKDLARTEHVTLYTLLLAAWQALLHRYSGQDDMLIGSPTAGTSRPEFAGVVGNFINVTVLRADCSGDPTFRTFLARTRDTVLAALDHQDFPDSLLVARLVRGQDPSRAPLYQVVFDYQRTPQSWGLEQLFDREQTGRLVNVGGLLLEAFPVPLAEGLFDLGLYVKESGDLLFGDFKYDTALFDAGTMRRLAQHLVTLLEGVVADPDWHLSELPLLTDAQRRHILAQRSATAAAPSDRTVIQNFEEQVARAPDAVALTAPDATLTYGELDARANRLAHHLHTLGIGPESLVGICMDRSAEMVVALLAILKAGGAYVPFDPAYPSARLEFMLQDCGARLLITKQALRDRLPAAAGVVTVCLDDPALSLDRFSSERPAPQAGPDNLAYVIYTSGSTGQPKGVAVTHRNITRLFTATESLFHFDDQDVWTLFHSYAFDFSVWEIWGALAYGGRLVIVDYWTSRSPDSFYELVREQGVTALNQTPSAFYQFVHADETRGQEELPLRLVIFGGEALDLRRLIPWFDRHGDERPALVNMYGITETTVHVTYKRIRRTDCTAGRSLIGAPIADLQLYVLDEALQPVPPGVAGEIFVGGAGLARGYLDRPELTAERFIPHPFSADHGARLYRSGDLARFLANGELEYLGRVDQQVKIRGFRVELGEIEAALLAHPAVRNAAVMAREDVPNQKRLVAYLVTADGGRAVPEGLAAQLAQRLPDYMLPSAFVLLDALPLNANGKVDRSGLPAPDPDSRELERTYVAPRTPIEEVLAGIFAETLELERVGIDDSFFDLGGHSLLAAQAIARIRKAFRVELSLRVLFEQPTVARLATTIEADLRAGLTSSAPPLQPCDRDEDLPLSFAQERLWFLDRLAPDSAVYNIPFALRLVGSLDAALLQQSLSEVVRRHEALRTTFPAKDGRPLQVIAPSLGVALPVIDLRELAEPAREAEVAQRARQEAQRPFDLTRGPLLRAMLLRLTDMDHVLLLSAHHIVLDGWSSGILRRELATIYTALVNGASPSLPNLPIQYADFSVWQRRWLQGEVLEEKLAYWMERLADAPRVLELPADRPRPAVETFRGAYVIREIPESLMAALEGLSRREGVTLYMLGLAAFQLLLARYSGTEDIVVGSPVAGRSQIETEGLIGFFVNTLILRSNLSGDPTFRELLGRVRDVALGAYAHQDLPFELLVQALRPDRDPSYNPLFQVMFALERAPREAFELPGVTWTAYPTDSGVAKLDLALTLMQAADESAFWLEYNTELFDRTTIERMADHFQTLLASVAAAPEQRLSELPLLTDTERRQILVEWNATASELPPDETVVELFEAQAARAPDALAVVGPDGTLTYRELDARASRLAQHLRARGIGPEALVGVCVERSAAMVVALLGVLKAGGAYVPFDPAYPSARLEFMLQDCGARLLVTQPALRERFAAVDGVAVVCLDDPALGEEAVAEARPAAKATPDNLAYVIYTSGSTGQPKGVEIEHRGLLNLVRWHQERFALSAADRATQVASPAFDATVWELWPYLTAGASVHIPDEQVRRTPALLQAWLIANEITIGFVPTPVAELLLELEWPPEPALRILLTGGDKLHRFAPPGLPFRLVNNYGPTENTVVTTSGEVAAEAPGGPTSRVPSIGRPIANTEVYVLDAALQPVPVGVPGELYVGGVGLARGYRGRPELTAERFIPHPFHAHPSSAHPSSGNKGARLYRTGDRVCYRPNGEIEFLGRLDDQVKLRGFRIELGEIEAALLAHPAVRNAAVVVREDVPNQKRLVAYLVTADGGHTVPEGLAAQLAQRLPDYMLPSAFVLLDALPLNANGKVDRAALPAPDPDHSSSAMSYVPPQTELQRQIAAIWQAVLQREQVGVHDNFFDLGGHSLFAAEVHSRLTNLLKKDLSLVDLFRYPTIATLARHLGDADPGPEGPGAPEKPSETRVYPLSHGQRALWLTCQLAPESASYNIGVTMRLRSEVDVAAMRRALQAVIDRHASLRSTFHMQADGPVQVVHDHLTAVFEHIDASAWDEDELRERTIRAQRRPFDLEQGPFLRAHLLSRSATDHVLMLVMHHIAVDGWSFSPMWDDLLAAYEAERAGQRAELPHVSHEYVDYVAWQEQMLAGPEGARLREYWHDQLRGELPVLNLPTDRPRKPMQLGRGATFEFKFDGELLQQLRGLARRERTTSFTILLAAFQLLLQRYTGQDDILIGTPVANRDREEFRDTIGYIAGIAVLRTDLSGDPTVRALLGRVRETVLGALEHQQYPFALLVEELQPERDPSRTPIFEVMFNLQRTDLLHMQRPERYAEVFARSERDPDTKQIRIAGLVLEPYFVPQEEGRFDLTIDLIDDEREREILGFLRYNDELWEESTINRLLESYRRLLTAMAESPAEPISTLPVLPPEERQRVLVAWNATQADYPAACLHDLIAAQAARTPQRVAVVDGERQLTYAELDRRANQLAHYLRSLGVGPDVLVGICVERSVDMVVVLLGILKSGGAYVPLDPAYPASRLAFMLQDSQARVLLTERGVRDRLPDATAHVVCLDADWPDIARQPASAPPPLGSVDDLAYVIYTSGSTGQPKGVQIAHRALVNFLTAMQREPGLSEHDVLLAVTTLSFDIAGLELYLPLLTGARVVLASRAVASDGAALGATIAEHGVTVMQATPATWRLLLDAGWPAGRPLKVLCGGEPLPPDLAAALLAQHVELWNMYGPTETTIWSTVARITSSEDITIGRPIANTEVYILDRHNQPVPIGAVGELLIGGDGLARGYLNRPELTAERFISHPFHSGTNARLYRTGDLARYLPDGRIDVLGRADNQVKVRGHRIELGEIEAALADHPAVREVVVVAREDEPGDKRLIAYLTAADTETPAAAELRALLRERLPEYMVPAAFVWLAELPRTPNGKIDRKALPAPEAGQGQAVGGTYVEPQTELQRTIAEVWRAVLQVEQVGLHDNFFDLGGHSLLLAQVHRQLRGLVDKELTVADLFRFPTVDALARHLASRDDTAGAPVIERRLARVRAAGDGQAPSRDVAIVGLAGRFPGARNIAEFWRNLCEGRECISFFTDEELQAAGVDAATLHDPHYVRARAVVDDIELFDAGFFGINAREAEILDPQHRIFLECAWEALEDAGCEPGTYDGAIGVFAGVSMNTYVITNLLANPQGILALGGYQAMISNDKDFLTTRVSYKLNLKGPSVAVQTACSTSLVAVHQACQSLLSGESDMALAGGISLGVPQRTGYLYQEGMILSPDGHCRAFDADAGGTIGGEGCGIVVLKRLADAVADGDHIYAVIKATSINNDGSLKVGYTAPSVDGQAEVIATAQALAGVTPDTIGYVEAHGTGTPLGDPIEIAALTQAFQAGGASETGYCAIGSLKTNIGHLDAAAGVAGLIKATLAVKHGKIPPSLNFQRPNPKIAFESSPFYVNTRLREWAAGATPRRAGISSFGIGGTNAHAVLEEPPAIGERPRAGEWQILPVAARTPTALDAATARLAEHLRQHPELSLADVAFTLQTGRRAFPHRLAVICREGDDIASLLEGNDARRRLTGVAEGEPNVAFMFSGQGAQYINMARGLYEAQPHFRSAVDTCAALLEPHLGIDLRSVLFPEDDASEDAATRLQQTALTQPALFVIEYALARQWMEWGVRPRAMIGHSIGEYVAACLAGVFSLEDALALVAARGRLMQALPPGAMLTVPLPAAEVTPLLGPALSLATVNAPALCVVAGPSEAVDTLQRELAGRGVECRRLFTSHAFHSAMMEPALAPFTEELRRIRMQPPSIPFVSNVTGDWITASQATDPSYWARHLRSTVRFADGLGRLLDRGNVVLLEVGPGQTLASLARQHPDREAARAIVTSVRHPNQMQPDAAVLFTALANLWLAGVSVDWPAVHGEYRPQRVPLPTYPFERQRYWLEPRSTSSPSVNGRAASAPRPAAHASPGDLDTWFSVPSWKRTLPPAPFRPGDDAVERSTWLVLADDLGLGEDLAQRLREGGQAVALVRPGDGFGRDGESAYRLDPAAPADYAALLHDLTDRGLRPRQIVHCWTVTADAGPDDRRARFDRAQRQGFYSLLSLGKAIAKLGTEPVTLSILTNGLYDLSGSESRQPEKATVLGPRLVLPQELPNITCRIVDVGLNAGRQDGPELADQIIGEIWAGGNASAVCYRGHVRWEQVYEPTALPAATAATQRLRPGGVYLITGGLGQIGLTLGEHLVRSVQARLVLTGRSGLPPRDAWEEWLSSNDESDLTSRRIRRVQHLEAIGGEVLVLAADAANEDEMESAVQAARERFGALDGIIYAAGIIDASSFVMLSELGVAEAERQFGPKVHGLYMLDRVVRRHRPDFCYVISSTSAVLGGLGFTAYAGANAFIDAFVAETAKTSSTPWLCVNWDGFTESESPVSGRGELRPMTPTEAAEVFDRTLAVATANQVVVSTTDLDSRLDTWVRRAESGGRQSAGVSAPAEPSANGHQPAANAAGNGHARPDLSSAYVAPETETERWIVAIWEELLGVEPVGIHDDFFELGGHSLLATRVVSRVREGFQVELSLRSLFEAATVAEIAAILDGLLPAAGDRSADADDAAGEREEVVL